MRFIAGLLFGIAMLTMPSRAEARLTAVSRFGPNPGALDMFEYVPDGLERDRPLVVVLHGCTQTAAAMEAAGWNALADEHRFAVLYPQQRTANQALGCFTWFAATDQSQGGEPASIISMVDTMVETHRVDPARVYVTGLSAGGGFTATLLATYPERFGAGSIMAGLPFKCATSQQGASGCQQMTAASQKTPAQWGSLVRDAAPGFEGTWPRVQIWQGSADYIVAPANATELVEQWTDVWNTDQTADATETISTATRTQYVTGETIAVEVYTIAGMGHAIATGADAMGACPATIGAYFADTKICSTLRTAAFFGLLAGGDGGGGGGGGGGGSGADEEPGEDDLGGCRTTGHESFAPLVLLLLALTLARRRQS